MIELRGKAVADEIKNRLKEQVAQHKAQNVLPKLAILRAGNRSDDLAYETRVIKNCQEVGIEVAVKEVTAEIGNDDFMKTLQELNDDNNVHGILMFRPLPSQLDEEALCQKIDPFKDVDCMNPINLQKVFLGDQEGFGPCTAEAVLEILKYYGYELQGKNMVIVNRSMVLGKPLAMLALQENATVTICHSKTKNLSELMKNADIVVTGVGRAKHFTAEYFSEKNIVMDVGINFDANDKMCGDVFYEQVAGKVSAITPVPGGIGAVTSAILLSHVLKGLALQCAKK